MPKCDASVTSISLADLLETPFPPRRYLIEPILREGESFMLWAAPGIGKTLFSMTLALLMAGGGEVLGFRSEGGRRVLLVDGEMNLMDLRDRFRDLLPTVEGLDAKRASSAITVLCRQSQGPEVDFPDLGTPEGQEFVMQMALDGGFDVVILDNLSTLASVEDENSAAAIRPVMRLLLKLKQAGVAVLLVHHAAKGGEKFRGSTNILTTFEASAGLRKPTSIKLGQMRADFDLAFDKFRGIRNEQTRAKRCWLEETKEGTLKWSFELSEEEELTTMLGALRSCRFATQGDLARHIGVSPATLTRMKARSVALGMARESDWRTCLEAGKAVSEDVATLEDDPF